MCPVEEAYKAFSEGREYRHKYKGVVRERVVREGSKIVFYYYDSRVAELEDNKVKIWHCGWHTPTSVELINGILNALGLLHLYSVHGKRERFMGRIRTLYVETPYGILLFDHPLVIDLETGELLNVEEFRSFIPAGPSTVIRWLKENYGDIDYKVLERDERGYPIKLKIRLPTGEEYTYKYDERLTGFVEVKKEVVPTLEEYL